ncbi:NACHT domain-containing protein, partial [Actinacidiphila glaucinigra]|uniref:NACHT domain-containing protein n=1 Tax=Actinacidiphila glaucinigra TaxID=235986 RepID=UPI0035D72AB0
MVSTTRDLSAGRQALRDALRKLESAALQGRDRTAAIEEANERRKASQLPLLQPTTVGGWFEKGTPAKDFATLWALVEVLYEWSGRPRSDSLSGPARAEAIRRWGIERNLWETLYEQAQKARPAGVPAAGSSSAVKAYLVAVQKTARAHPYPDAWGDTHLPDLTDVYVPQQAAPQTSTDHNNPGPAQHAEEVFRTGSSITVLLAPAGSGKSTLLRTHRAESASRYLDGELDATVPLLVNAGDLTTADPLPTALAKAATGELARFGLLDELTADLFRHPPRPKNSWLVLVDGLDEIPNADTRRAVVQTLTETAAARPALYRFVVATRPLPTRELDALGPHVPRFELRPFSAHNLQTYATNWFRDLDAPSRHVQAFIAGLRRSRLDVLARTPLMAFLLCRLYRADPARLLPHGRTGVYQACVELLYELNEHKNIKTTHAEVIRRLKDRHQIPRDILAAEKAAQQVREHLPELIDYLAHARVNGNTLPAVEILTSHLRVQRPQRLKEHLWSAFIGDLLRPIGLLTEQGDDFHFLHQTLLEYHAARHATRNEQSRAQLLHDLIASPSAPADGRLEPPDLDASYLGFLLDGLLAPQDRIAAETTQYVEELTAHGGDDVCWFLAKQVLLRTSLPTRPAAAHLAWFANNTALQQASRVLAAEALAEVDREAGVARLAHLANDTSLHGVFRTRAATVLAEVDREAGVARLAHLANDTSLHQGYRVRAATVLAEVDREAGVARL